MKRFGYILSLIPAILLAGNSFSQQVIATAGSSGSGAGIQLSWTIGEPITSTTHGSDFYLTQGFHQSQPITAIVNQELSLDPGWNIMSVRLIPGNKNLMDVFQLLINANILKKVMDESGKVVEDWGFFGGWQNTIGSMKSTEGYKVNVKTPTTLSVGGTKFLFPFYIPLSAGWNIISWPSANEQDGMEVFQTLKNEGKLKKVMDESGKVIEDWGYFGGWQNTIGNLKPGEGYKVNVTGDCTLIINESGTKSETVVPETLASTHFVPAFRGNGTDHMNIHLVNLTESGIKQGDEIGIFDGNICVGSVKIVNHQSLIVNRNSISIPVSAIDGIEDKNGYSEGNPILLKLFRNGNEYPLTIQPINQSNTVFEKGSSLFAQVDLATSLQGKIAGTNQPEINCYPNPFSEEVNIEIKLAQDSEVQVEVLNQLGQRVKTLATERTLNNGTHLLKWNGKNTANQQVSSGIYMIRIMIGSEISFKKIIYSKVE